MIRMPPAHCACACRLDTTVCVENLFKKRFRCVQQRLPCLLTSSLSLCLSCAVPFMSSLPTLLRSSSLQASSVTDTPAFLASRAPSQDLQAAGNSPQLGTPLSATLQQQQHQPQQVQRQGSLRAGTTGARTGAPPTACDPVMSQPWTELLGGLWGSFGTGVVQLAWLLGRVAVPTACVVFAGSQADVLHGVYLVIMLAYLLAPCIGLQPQQAAVPYWWTQYVRSTSSSASMGRQDSALQPSAQRKCPDQQEQVQPHALPADHLPQHRLLRLYGSCHLMVVYLALVLQLPGLDSELNEYILRLVGLWDPKILSDLVPVLLLLVAATTHVILGKWLLTRPPAGAAWTAAATGADGRQQPRVAAAVADAHVGAGGCSSDAVQGVLAWVHTVYAQPVLGLLLAAAKLACSAGAALLVLLVSIAF